MGSFAYKISTVLSMSIVCALLQKSASSNTTYLQGVNSSDFFSTIKQSSYSHGNISETTHSVRKELPHTGSDTRLDYSDLYNMSYNDDYDYGDEYMYAGFPFERPMYLYIWEILVILTFLVNIVVVSVLLRKNMRSATNLILAAIAISDTLTGLVTLPTYIMVYHKYDPLQDNHTFGNITNNESITLPPSAYAKNLLFNQEFGISSDENQNMTFVSSTPMYGEIHNYDHYATQPPLDGYILTKDLCHGFMISKYFLSKSFHSVSIFLTLFLGIQRYVSVAFPFKSQSIFTVNKTIIFCVIIFFLSPLLHGYHLATDKAVEGLCQWHIGGDGCGGGCIYLWVLFIIRHLIPCVSLTTFTILFINNLRLGTKQFRRMDSNASQLSRRMEENRRISIIVTTIVVVFLIPEIPYGIFLLYSAILKTINKESRFDLETNRGIHMAYELLLVLTFNANFYIYTFLNKKFRKCLNRTYIKPMQRLFGGTRRLSISRTSTTSKWTARKTGCSSSQGAMEMKNMQASRSDKSVTMETKIKHSVSVDASNGCSNANINELSALNANVQITN